MCPGGYCGVSALFPGGAILGVAVFGGSYLLGK
jgi:hypothetical protein